MLPQDSSLMRKLLGITGIIFGFFYVGGQLGLVIFSFGILLVAWDLE
jgi:hypothetical protein